MHCDVAALSVTIMAAGQYIDVAGALDGDVPAVAWPCEQARSCFSAKRSAIMRESALLASS